MRNHHLTTLFSILIVLALLGILIIAFWLTKHPVYLSSEAKPLTHAVLVVDFDNDGVLNEEELLRGTDAILAVRTQNRDELFNSIAALRNADRNKDNQIDAKNDPIFPYLELVFLKREGKERKYVLVTEAGIKAIIIDKQRITPQLKENKDNLVGSVVFKNGNKRALRLLEVKILE